MMDIFAKSIARAGGIETADDRRIVPMPRPVADHTAIVLAALGRGAAALARAFEHGAEHFAAHRRLRINSL
jgi:hypothetical protein